MRGRKARSSSGASWSRLPPDVRSGRNVSLATPSMCSVCTRRSRPLLQPRSNRNCCARKSNVCCGEAPPTSMHSTAICGLYPVTILARRSVTARPSHTSKRRPHAIHILRSRPRCSHAASPQVSGWVRSWTLPPGMLARWRWHEPHSTLIGPTSRCWRYAVICLLSLAANMPRAAHLLICPCGSTRTAPKHGALVAGFPLGAARRNLPCIASPKRRGLTRSHLSRRTSIRRAASHFSSDDVSPKPSRPRGDRSQQIRRRQRPGDFSSPRYGTRARMRRQDRNARPFWQCNLTHRLAAGDGSKCCVTLGWQIWLLKDSEERECRNEALRLLKMLALRDFQHERSVWLYD